MTGDESIAGVADSTRNEAEEHDPGPRPTEASKDLENGVRFCISLVIDDQNHAGQLSGAFHPLFDHRLTCGRLLCSEAKNSGRIATDYESHPAVAQIADSVEQNNRRWRCDSHQLTNARDTRSLPPHWLKLRLERSDKRCLITTLRVEIVNSVPSTTAKCNS